MASPLVRELLDAGIHFGHRCARWNPKMAPHIYGKRNGIHIIDIRETLRGLLRAKKFLSRVVANGEDVLFVGTKRQARESVEEQVGRCNMHFVTERWLGGTLTNFRTIRSRLQRLEELENLVNSPEWESDYSKKMRSTLSRELKKIRRNLDGVRNMNRLPGALVLFDVRKEHNAVREATSLNIPTVALVDTDSDPTEVNIAIPGNDDSMRSIAVITRHLADAVEEGAKSRPEPAVATEPRESGDPGAPGRRRRRPNAPAREAGAAAPAADSGASTATMAPEAPPATERPEAPPQPPGDESAEGARDENQAS